MAGDGVRSEIQSATLDMSDLLWNDIGPDDYTSEGDSRYRGAVLEQYKLYVEMADRVSQRRGLTNTFFLTLNTAIFTLIGLFWSDRAEAPTWVLVFPLIVILGQCFAWYHLVRSYRLLNTAKYRVVGELETQLPASPYWRAEWTALAAGRDRGKYWQLAHIETWVPSLFGVTYTVAFVATLVW